MSPATKTTQEKYVTMPVFEQSMRAIATSFSDLDERLDARFEAIDLQFKQIDERFKKVDARFDAIDQRFEAVDRRFDGMDRKLDDIVLEMKRMNANIEEHQLAIKLFIQRDMRREM